MPWQECQQRLQVYIHKVYLDSQQSKVPPLRRAELFDVEARVTGNN